MNRQNIVLIGMPGCGKSTVGRHVSSQTGLQFVDLDRYIEERSGQTIPQLFEQGESVFRAQETTACQDFSEPCGCVIATGGGVVLKEENMRLLKSGGRIIFLDRDLDHILSDIECSTRPLLKKGKQAVEDLYRERITLYRKYADLIIPNNATLSDCIEKVIQEVENSNENYGH